MEPGYALSGYSAAISHDINGNPNPPGGANSDYTAADNQHMLVAAQVSGGTGLSGMYTPEPSLHRPELINYWQAQGKSVDTTMQLTPLRTSQTGASQFTGSNPNFNATWDGITAGSSQWDVDNDGDGIADSVWVDLGFPVRAAADGRLYKPLFAILCVDLDGRLNLNAHSMLAHASTADYSSSTSAGVSFVAANPSTEFTSVAGMQLAGAGASSVVLPRGLGYGPGEINLLPLFVNSSGNPSQFAPYLNAVLAGTGAYSGRYGGTPGSGVPGISGYVAPLTFNKWYNYAGSPERLLVNDLHGGANRCLRRAARPAGLWGGRAGRRRPPAAAVDGIHCLQHALRPEPFPQRGPRLVLFRFAVFDHQLERPFWVDGAGSGAAAVRSRFQRLAQPVDGVERQWRLLAAAGEAVRGDDGTVGRALPGAGGALGAPRQPAEQVSATPCRSVQGGRHHQPRPMAQGDRPGDARRAEVEP